MNDYSLTGFLGEELSGCASTLRDTSFDKENKEHLCEDVSLPYVYDFDEYIRVKFPRSATTPASPDAIYLGDKKLYFIEFKNQKKSAVDTAQLKEKFRQGTVILKDMLSEFKPRDNQFVFCVVFKPQNYQRAYQGYIESRQVHFGLKELNEQLGGFYDELVTQNVNYYKNRFATLSC